VSDGIDWYAALDHGSTITVGREPDGSVCVILRGVSGHAYARGYGPSILAALRAMRRLRRLDLAGLDAYGMHGPDAECRACSVICRAFPWPRTPRPAAVATSDDAHNGETPAVAPGASKGPEPA